MDKRVLARQLFLSLMAGFLKSRMGLLPLLVVEWAFCLAVD